MQLSALAAALLLLPAGCEGFYYILPPSQKLGFTTYYLRVDPKGRAPKDQHRTAPNAHLTAPWPMGLG